MKKQKRSEKIANRIIEFTNESKILFPKSKITKGDLIQYYLFVSKRMLSQMKDRPISMLRYPNGIEKEGFFQKNISKYFPSWIQTKLLPKKQASQINMLICNDRATLAYLANQGCISFHLWLSRKDKPYIPDRVIFDLDPSKGCSFKDIKEGAKDLKNLLEKSLSLTSFVMTTGSKGLHVIVPIKREKDFEDVKVFAKNVAQVLVLKKPTQYTIQQRIEKRGSKIFIDYLRNAYAQTGIAPYSVRALEGAPIAMPIEWDELRAIEAQSFNIKNISSRLSKKDPWQNMNRSAKNLKTASKKIDKILSDLY